MYGLMLVALAALMAAAWQTERAWLAHRQESAAVDLAALQRMRSQRVARLSAKTVAGPAGVSGARAELERELDLLQRESQRLREALAAWPDGLARDTALAATARRWAATSTELTQAARELADLSGARPAAHAELREQLSRVDAGADPARRAAHELVGELTRLANARHERAAGRARQIASAAVLLFIALGLLAVEPTARKLARQHARLRGQTRRLQRLATVARLTGHAVWIVDAGGRISWVNPAFERLTGYTRHDLNDGPGAELRSQLLAAAGGPTPGERRKVEIKARDGTPRWVDIDRRPIDAGKGQAEAGFVHVATDITERRRDEALIQHLALYDALTDLPNRRLLRDRLQQVLGACQREQRHAALLFVDLDNFKAFNDARGHEAGDRLLLEVARRLEGGVQAGDTVARQGGDKFVVVLEACDDETPAAGCSGGSVAAAVACARRRAEALRTELARPFELDGISVRPSASIGLRLIGPEDDDLDALLKHAEATMYGAKKDGRNAVRLYDAATYGAMKELVELDVALRAALTEGGLALHLQPQVDAQGRMTGAEALLRWEHAGLGSVSPGKFIPVAEASDLIVDLGQWVLGQAANQLARWRGDARTRALQLAINVSARQFRQPDFVASVCDALDAAGAPRDRLVIELTEGLVLEDVEDAVVKMTALRSAGVRFAMDDFGTHHASLSYLVRLPLDKLKIDQSFIRGVTQSARQEVVVRTIIGMAGSLGLEVIAEGVETEPQRAFLAANGCLHYQGYLFGRPVPAEALAPWIDALGEAGVVSPG